MSTTSEISTPRKPTRVIRNLSRAGAISIPARTEVPSTTGPNTGPICKKARAISIGVNRPNAFTPTKLRASTTRKAPTGRTISRLEGFRPQTACETAIPPSADGMSVQREVFQKPSTTSASNAPPTAQPM